MAEGLGPRVRPQAGTEVKIGGENSCGEAVLREK